ncbi:MAG: hypothetical protein SOU06_06320 [Bulleidia sp.]|nr:hypothetical protein [Bulleidia sp.]
MMVIVGLLPFKASTSKELAHGICGVLCKKYLQIINGICAM